MTSSPTFSLLLAPGERTVARVVDLDHGDVGLGVGADDRGRRLDAVMERDGDLLAPSTTWLLVRMWPWSS